MTHEKEYSTVWPTKKNIYRIALKYEYNTVWPTKKYMYRIALKYEYNTVWPTKKSIYSMTPKKGELIPLVTSPRVTTY